MQQVSIRNKWISLRGGSRVKDMEERDVLYVKGKPAAMTLASPISDSVLDVIYEKAVEERYRFFSFGDAMMITDLQ